MNSSNLSLNNLPTSSLATTSYVPSSAHSSINSLGPAPVTQNISSYAMPPPPSYANPYQSIPSYSSMHMQSHPNPQLSQSVDYQYPTAPQPIRIGSSSNARPRSRRTKSMDDHDADSTDAQAKKKRRRSMSKATEPWHSNKPLSPSDNSPTSSLNRPRGRPPILNGTESLGDFPAPLSNKRSSSNAGILKTSSSANFPPLPPNSTSGSNGNNGTTNSSASNAGASGATKGNEAEGAIKIPRPTYKFVVGKVLAKLMVSDPISLADLIKLLNDCPKDMIHSVLEISQVLGIVIQSKAKEGLKEDYPAGTLVFSLINYVKGPNPVALDKLEEDIQNRMEYEMLSTRRMAELNVSDSFDLHPHHLLLLLLPSDGL